MSKSTPATWKKRLLNIAAGSAAVGALVVLGSVASGPVPVPDSFTTDMAVSAMSAMPAADHATMESAATPQLHAQSAPSVAQYCEAPGGAAANAASPLPALRWQSFGLSHSTSGFFGQFSAGILNLISILFHISALMWSVLIQFLEFGLSFKPLCYTAPSVNSMTAIVGRYSAFFLVPALVYALWVGRKHLFGGNLTKGLAGVGAILLAFGATFYVTDRADVAERTAGNDPSAIIQTTGTMPWVLANITQVFSGVNSAITTSLGDMSEVAAGQVSGRAADSAAAFYDGASETNELTCAAFDEGLVKLYEDQVIDSGIANPAGMVTMNELWERAFLSNWMTAQMGPGSAHDNEYPAMVACRVLESRVEGPPIEKAQTFLNAYEAAGVNAALPKASEIVESGQVYLMHPGLSSQAQTYAGFAWAYCGDYKGGKWNPTSGAAEMKRSDDISCNSGDDEKKGGTILGETLEPASNDDGPLAAANEMVNSSGKNVHKFDDGEDSIDDRIGQSIESEDLREWAFHYIGAREGTRMLSGILALVTSVLYLWSFGPAALGLVIAGVGMILLATIVPLSLVLWGIGKEVGKRMLALTGATALATFLFTLVLSFLAAIVSILTNFVLVLFPDGGSSTTRQLFLAALPVVALFLVRWAMRKMGLPNMTSLAGSLGMVSGLAAKTAGDQKLTGTTTSLGDRFSRKGMQDAKKARQRDPSAVQRSLGDRFRNNALAQRVGNSVLGNAAKHVGLAAKDTIGHGKDVAADHFNRLPGVQTAKEVGKSLAKTKSGKYGAAALGLAAVGGAAPVALLGMGAAGLAAAGGEHGLTKFIDGRLNPARLSASAARRRATRASQSLNDSEIASMSPGYERGQVAGIETTHDAKAAERDATRFRHHLDRIPDPKERDQILSNYVDNNMGMLRARQNGAKSVGGLNTTFSGFESVLAQADAQFSAAQQMGLAEQGVIVSSHGLIAPAAVTLAENGAPKLPATATLATASHPIHYLDEATVRRQDQEDDDAYMARIHASMVARGLVDTEGKVVDVFATKGIDINTSSGATRVEEWLAGGQDEELASLQFAPVKGEHRVVSKALSWSNQESGTMMERQWEQANQAAELQGEMLSTLRNPGHVVITGGTTPDGKDMTTTLDTVHQSLALDLSRMTDDLEVASTPDAVSSVLSRMSEVEDRAKQVIDGLEASAMARAAVQVQEFSMARRGEVDPRELRNLSRDAVAAADHDSHRRRAAVDKTMADLASLGNTLRNNQNDDARTKAHARAVELVQNLNEDMARTRMAEMEANREMLEEFEATRQAELERQEAEKAAGRTRFSPKHRPTTSKDMVKSHGNSRRFR